MAAYRNILDLDKWLSTMAAAKGNVFLRALLLWVRDRQPQLAGGGESQARLEFVFQVSYPRPPSN